MTKRKARKKVVKDDEIVLTLPYQPASRKRSWVTNEQVEKEHWEVMAKICDILFSPGKYDEKCVDYARSVMDFLVDWEFISWKQFDSVMCMNPKGQYPYVLMVPDKTRLTEGEYYVNVASQKLRFTIACTGNAKVAHASEIRSIRTDRQMDAFHTKIFGHPPIFEENAEGLMTDYDRSGRRFFALPLPDDDMSDVFMSHEDHVAVAKFFNKDLR